MEQLQINFGYIETKKEYAMKSINCISKISVMIILLGMRIWPLEINRSQDSVQIAIGKSDLSISEIKEGDHAGFSRIRVKGTERCTDPGEPELPGVSVMFSGNEPDVSYNVRDSFVVQDLKIKPSSYPEIISRKKINNKNVRLDEKAYSSGPFPCIPVLKQKLFIHRGVEEWKVEVIPFKYYPEEERLTVYKDISVRFNKGSRKTRRLNSLSTEEMERLSLIITHDDFLEAGDSLGMWHKMQGFETDVVASDSWSVESVDSLISERYSDPNTRPSYVTLIGDLEYIPSQEGVEDGDTYYTDLYYYCMDGEEDYMPEIAGGRIPALSNTEALNIIGKIKDFGLDPPLAASFYSDFLSCSYFQDYDPKDGYADRSFSRTANEVTVYLDSLGYNGKRVFYAEEEVSPQYWNDGTYGFGNPVPDYLEKPGFAWDGSQGDIIEGFNQGKFFVLHYDHGYYDGWKHPAFYKTRFENLDNQGILPFVLSINCYTGEFHSESFAKELLRMESGGALGVIAGSGVTYSGYNDGLIAGLIDAVWPNFEISTPEITDPEISEHEPCYRLGDILVYGYKGIINNWSEYYAQYHCETYHLLGDPTAQFYTAMPREIAADVPEILYAPEHRISLEWIDQDSVKTVVISRENGKILGKTFKTDEDSIVSISEIPSDSDSVMVVLTGRNMRPEVSYVSLRSAVSNDLPELTIKPSGRNMPEGSSLSIEVSASDSDGVVDSVRCYINDTFVSADTEKPFLWDRNSEGWELLDSLDTGEYLLKCIAYDNSGGISSDSLKVNIYEADSIYLAFEGSVEDSFGDNNGSAYGVIQYDEGFMESASYFNGEDSYIKLSCITSWDFTVIFSIEPFVIPDTLTEYGLFDVRNSSKKDGFCVSLKKGKLIVEIKGTDSLIYKDTDMADSTWYNMALTREANTGFTELFVEGIRVDAGSITQGALDTPDSMYISSFAGDSGYYTGGMDNVYIFNRALSVNEIQRYIPETENRSAIKEHEDKISVEFTGSMINLKNITHDVEVKLYDIKGRRVLKKRLSSGDNTVDLRGFAEGIYLMRFKKGQEELDCIRFYIH